MTSRLLLVEPSATMRYVLENYVQSLGFSVVAYGEYTEAENALRQQFQSYGSDFTGVLLGWPALPSGESDSLVETLESADFTDLPVVVMSTDMRAETRAWVSARENTAVLPWKEYQGLESLLQRMLQPATEHRDAFEAKFDNSDIHILVVDDSVSIRFALRDLFQLQGYRVSLASTHEEAMVLACQTPFDIAVLDFYLQDGTGDALCRELINEPQTGQLTCAMLTGTYADHIIKRSLRSGAVECMFKNESSELLLARIDALGRFVRQRKHLAEQQRRLDLIVDSLAGATLVVSNSDTISYASEQASSLLGFDQRQSLLEINASEVLDMARLRSSGDGKFKAQWRDAAQGAVNAVYRQIALENSGDIVVNFKLLPADSTAIPPAAAAVHGSAAGIVAELELLSGAEQFVDTLIAYTTDMADTTDFVSLLMLDVSISNEHDRHEPVDANEELLARVSWELGNVYKREHHVTRLHNNRFAFLLRHTTEPQAYLLTRKIMQICNAISIDDLQHEISCTGCLLSVSNNRDITAMKLLERTAQGLEVVNVRGQNQALLLDLRRMLPVYAAS